MTTTPTGPSKPDPTQPILVGAARPAVPAPPVPPVHPAGAPVPPRRRPTGLIAVVVVLAVALLGLGGWAVLRPYLGGATGTPTGPGASHPATQPAPTGSVPPTDGPVYVPFDLAQGLADAVDGVNSRALGVWDGVAVFAVATGSSTPYSAALRAVDVKTGTVLWTLGALPDGGSTFGVTGAAAWNGTLAVSAVNWAFVNSTWTQCAHPAYVLLLSLREGTLTGARPLDSQCTEPGTGFTYSTPVVTAYADGIVAVDMWQGPLGWRIDGTIGTITTTTGYADTDLATPVWQVDGTGDPITAIEGRPTPLLSGHWVMAASDVVVDIRTGKPSPLKGGPYYPRGLLYPDGFVAVGDNVVWGTGGGDQDYRSFTMWSSPASAQPEWSYTPPAGWDSALPVCYSDDVMIVWLGDGRQVDENAGVVALDRANGHTLWSTTYPLNAGTWTTPPVACTIMGYEGDKELVVLSPYAGPDVQVRFLDAVSGRDVMDTLHWSDPDGSNTDADTLSVCGTDLVCAFTSSNGTIGSSILPISLAGPVPVALPPHPWLGFAPLVDPATGIVGIDVLPEGGGKGEFALM